MADNLNSSALRSSHPSRCYLPDSDSPNAPVSGSSSPLPSSEHQFPLSSQHAASHPSETYLSPLSAHQHPSTPNALLHPATNSMAEHVPAHPFLNSQPSYGIQPSTSIHQLEHPMYSYSFPPPPEHLARLPSPQGPYHRLPTTNIPYPNPIPMLQNSQHIYRAQPFAAIRQPGDLVNENCDSVHPLQGQVSNQQGQTVSFPPGPVNWL